LADHKTGGLYVGVMFINMASIVAAVWVVARFASPSLTVTMLIALAVMCGEPAGFSSARGTHMCPSCQQPRL